MIANAEKIKKRPSFSRVDTLETIERSIASRIDSKGSHRNSKSLVPLPSQRGNPLISPKRRQVPESVKKFQRLQVIELEQPRYLMEKLSSSFQVSPRTRHAELQAKHLKCSSMFMQTMKFGEEDEYDEQETQEADDDVDAIDHLEISCSPKYEELPCINVLAPKTTTNQCYDRDDEVRFSSDSCMRKMTHSHSRPGGRPAPKVLKFTVQPDEELYTGGGDKKENTPMRKKLVNEKYNPLESTDKKRNNRIAVLDYLLKH